MAALWTCKLCTQRNPADVARCSTCGRDKNWSPTPSPAPSVCSDDIRSPPRTNRSPETARSDRRSDLSRSNGRGEPEPYRRNQTTGLAYVSMGSGLPVGAAQEKSMVNIQPYNAGTVGEIQAGRETAQQAYVGDSLFDWLTWFINFFCVLIWPFRILRHDQQLRVQHFSHISVTNGPGFQFVNPCKPHSIVQAETLGPMDYVRIRNELDASERAARGPMLLFLGPYERVHVRGQGISLTNTQYVIIQDKNTGERRVERGPMVWIPKPREEGYVHNAIKLSSNEYVTVQDGLTGVKRIDKGPTIWFPGAHEEYEKNFSIWLDSTEYIAAQDMMNGTMRIDKGPLSWFPGPYDTWEKGTSVRLTSTQYIIVFNKSTGTLRTVPGPNNWFPEPFESPSEVFEAVVLLDDEFVKLKDTSTGNRWIQRGKCLVFLEPTWEVEGISSRNTGVQKSTILKLREYVRLQVAPHLKMTKSRTD